MGAGLPGAPGENVPGPAEEGYSFHTVNARTLSLRMEEDTAWVGEPSTSHATRRNVPLMVIATYGHICWSSGSCCYHRPPEEEGGAPRCRAFL